MGSCHMGMGQVLSEEMKYGRTGHLINPDLLDYKIPTVHEMPLVTPIIVESNDPEGPSEPRKPEKGHFSYSTSGRQCRLRRYWSQG